MAIGCPRISTLLEGCICTVSGCVCVLREPLHANTFDETASLRMSPPSEQRPRRGDCASFPTGPVISGGEICCRRTSGERLDAQQGRPGRAEIRGYDLSMAALDGGRYGRLPALLPPLLWTGEVWDIRGSAGSVRIAQRVRPSPPCVRRDHNLALDLRAVRRGHSAGFGRHSDRPGASATTSSTSSTIPCWPGSPLPSPPSGSAWPG